jgi:hypothetical protein
VGREVPAHTLLQNNGKKLQSTYRYVMTEQINTVSHKNRGKLEPMLRIWDVYTDHVYRILIIIHPGSRISDPGSNNSNKKGGEKLVVLPFFEATNITKLRIILF